MACVASLAENGIAKVSQSRAKFVKEFGEKKIF
jgi:hypothetical protein